jgi:hypothetical protein
MVGLCLSSLGKPAQDSVRTGPPTLLSKRHKLMLSAVIVVSGAALAVALGLASQTDDTCSLDPACREHGRCTSSFGFCVVGSHVDCWVAETCKRHGHCRLQDGACVLGMPIPP